MLINEYTIAINVQTTEIATIQYKILKIIPNAPFAVL
jgi:hypothetical protein